MNDHTPDMVGVDISKARRDLDELLSARDDLVKDRTESLNQQKHARNRLLRRQSKNRLDLIGRHIKAVDAAIAKLSAASRPSSP